MTPDQAISVIHNMRFRPGWSFKAEVNWLCDEGEIYVEAKVASYDTSYRTADGALTRPMTMDPEAIIKVTDLNEAGLFNALIAQLVRPFDDHEDREFMVSPRPGGRWYAPLHPHTPEGNAAWDERHNALRRVSQLRRDLENAL